MTPLGLLIKQARDKFQDDNGVELSYGDIARRSGGRLGRTRVQQLATLPIKAIPDVRTIEGLALGLTVPSELVMLRALESAGYPIPSDPHRRGVRQHTQEQLDAALTDVENMRRRDKEQTK